MKYELHPLCTLFPRLDDAAFAVLVEDIRANGLRHPIVVHEGMILDGGNRYRACIEAGIEPSFAAFDGGNIVSFVLSANLHRRHLSAGQQAAIVASAQDWSKAQTHGGHRHADQAVALPLDTVAQRASESGASDKTQRMADKVARANPELAKQVAHGEISLPAAVKKIAPKTEKVVPINPNEPDASEDFGPSAEELEEAEIEIRLNRESYDRILAADDKAAALDAEVRRLNERLKVEIGQKNRFMNEAAEWKRRYLRAQRANKVA